MDTVEISSKKEKKKGLSTGAKWGIGLGILATGAIAAFAIITKQMPKHLEKLYKEKLVPKTFGEKLVYDNNMSKEDAIKYAKETLGVKEVDETISLEALHFANSGIVDVVNKNIGQEVFIPTKYIYTNKKLCGSKDNFIAYVDNDITNKDFGALGINKNYFDKSFLDKKLDEFYNTSGVAQNQLNSIFNNYFKKDINGHGLQLIPVDKNGKNMKELIEDFKKNPNSLSLEDKRLLFSFDIRTMDAIMNPLRKFDYAKFLEKNNIKDLDISSKKLLEIHSAINDYCQKNNKNLICKIEYPLEPKSDIYHEMGHLQDFAKNLKELNLKTCKIPIWKRRVNEYGNRWGGTTYDGYEKLLKENPEKFKKRYPDLYEHLTNEEIKETSLKVSDYASTSIGEFVAEVYAMMISGREIPSDVMNLYKKYNGPLPNGFK